MTKRCDKSKFQVFKESLFKKNHKSFKEIFDNSFDKRLTEVLTNFLLLKYQIGHTDYCV
jgi:hypothetical protein